MDHAAPGKLRLLHHSDSSPSMMNLFPGTPSSYSDPDVIEVPAPPPSSSSYNRKRKIIDIVPIDEDEDEVVILGQTLPNHKPKPKPKNKLPLSLLPPPPPPPPPPLPNIITEPSLSLDWLLPKYPSQKPYFQFPHTYTTNLPLPLPLLLPPAITPPPPHVQPSLASTMQHFTFPSYDYFKDDGDDFFDDIDSLFFDNAAMSVDPPLNLDAKFDDLHIPTGVEISLPWLQKCFPPGNATASSSGSALKQPKVPIEEIDINYKAFKQFDTVTDHTDHHFMGPKFKSASQKPTKEWTKRIQNDWKLLEKDLPDSILVRVYEDRMDLLRAVIIGPAGTPYHDGLFFFDVHFPSSYPHMPPMVHYNSGGLRLNPNLYACGKVCLSLLNTWSGSGCERWNPANSTMLQVLVSIQALVLNSKPYFNEPAYSIQANTPHAEQKSLAYNETTFLLSCKTMLYSLQRPPKHFEHFVAGHFRERGYAILLACRAYIEGAQVGCLVGDGVQDVDEGDKSSSSSFKTSLKRIFENLLMEFTVKGADCDEFLAQKRNQGTAAVPAPQATPATVTELSLGGHFSTSNYTYSL